MAKMQKATLDPSKISGYCGRLKCCLRYEDKTYTELKKRLPKKKTVVKTKHGQGKVLDTQILTQLVVVELDNGTKIAVPVEELEIVSPPEATATKEPDSSPKKSEKDTKETKNNNKAHEDDQQQP
jgi:hypothetical protein